MREENNNPLVSIVMPVFNTEHFLVEAIKSILNQTFKDFEFIIIDSFSDNNCWNIIQVFQKYDPRIIALRKNTGEKLCDCLNEGISLAKGKYIARIDSNDVCLPDRLEKQVGVMENDKEERIGICGTNQIIIDNYGNEINIEIFPNSNEDCRKAFWHSNPFGHGTVLIRKSCFSDFGSYNESFRYAEDLELWMRFGQKYDFFNIQESLVKHRTSKQDCTLNKHEEKIKNILRSRRLAVSKYGYHMDTPAIFNYFATWISQFLPSKLVSRIFNS